MRKIEETLKREVGLFETQLLNCMQLGQHLIDSDRSSQMYNELKAQLKYNEEQLSEKIRVNKKSVSDLEEACEKKYQSRLLFEEKNKATSDKLYDLQQRIKELEKKSDFPSLLERQNGRLKSVEEKLSSLDQELVESGLLVVSGGLMESHGIGWD